MTVSKIQRWGNGQGLRLSTQVLDMAGIAVGDDVEIVIGEREITIRKARRPRIELADLVARIPKGYRARENDSGSAVGREEW